MTFSTHIAIHDVFNMRMPMLLIAFCTLFTTIGCVENEKSDGENPSKENKTGISTEVPSGDVRLMPVVKLSSSSQLAVPVALHNSTDSLVKYATSYGAIIGINYSLVKDGKLVPRGSTPSPAGATNVVVKELKPGEYLHFSHQLHYPKLSPGEYIIKLKYEIHKGSGFSKKYDVTPQQIVLFYLLIITP